MAMYVWIIEYDCPILCVYIIKTSFHVADLRATPAIERTHDPRPDPPSSPEGTVALHWLLVT